MDSGAKIRIKVGSMEVEYEGEPSFLKDGLESLLAKMAELSTQVLTEPEQEAIPRMDLISLFHQIITTFQPKLLPNT